jgi:endoglucanase
MAGLVFISFILTFIFSFTQQIISFQLPSQFDNIPFINLAYIHQPIPVKRFKRLAKGVNIYDWFGNNEGRLKTKAERLKYFTTLDAIRLQRMGITNVRLSVADFILFDEAKPQILKNPNVLAEIDQAITLLNRQGISVTFSLRGLKNTMIQLYKNPQFESKYLIFWNSLARHLRKFSPEMLFLEIVNEPSLIQGVMESGDGSWSNYEKALSLANKKWSGVQEKLLTVIRREAPRHTVVLSGDAWSSIPGLIGIKPLRDKNVVYTIHIYDPLAFTHQGATWVGEQFKQIKGLTYPAIARNCEEVKIKVLEQFKYAVNEYCQKKWNRFQQEENIKQALNWANKYGVKLWVGETGVYPDFAPPGSAEIYLRDIRLILEKYQVGWSIWEYVNWLKRFESPSMRKALGLS